MSEVAVEVMDVKSKEATNKMMEHVGRKTIQVKQLPNNFKLSVKVFIAAETEVANSMQ